MSLFDLTHRRGPSPSESTGQAASLTRGGHDVNPAPGCATTLTRGSPGANECEVTLDLKRQNRSPEMTAGRTTPLTRGGPSTKVYWYAGRLNPATSPHRNQKMVGGSIPPTSSMNWENHSR